VTTAAAGTRPAGQAELEALREAGTYKRFNTLVTAGPVVEMAGRGEVLVLSSNNYLLAGRGPGRWSRRDRGLRLPAVRHPARCAYLRHLRAAPRGGGRACGACGHGRRRCRRSRAGTRTGGDPHARGRGILSSSPTAQSRLDHRRHAPVAAARKVIYKHSSMDDLREGSFAFSRAARTVGHHGRRLSMEGDLARLGDIVVGARARCARARGRSHGESWARQDAASRSTSAYSMRST
jgi:hypothetical protein